MHVSVVGALDAVQQIACIAEPHLHVMAVPYLRLPRRGQEHHMAMHLNTTQLVALKKKKGEVC